MRHMRKYGQDPLDRVFSFPTLLGFDEEDSDETSESEDEDEDEDNSEEDEDNDSEEDEDDDESEEEEEKDDTKGLKSALDKERRARKDLAKELKALRKFKDKVEEKDQTEAQKAEKRAEKAEKALQKAQEQLQRTQVDFVISEAAKKLKFRDTDDALRLVDRSEIEFDEDGEFDKKAVEKAVKAVRDKKPHLVLSDGEKPNSGGGSKFGGSKKNDKKASKDKLKQKYPALGR